MTTPGKRYWWEASRKSKSGRHRKLAHTKAHVKPQHTEHLTSKNRPGGPL